MLWDLGGGDLGGSFRRGRALAVTYEEGVGENWDLADRIEQAENMKDGKNQPSDDEDLEEVHQAPAKARRKTHRGTRGKKRPSLPDHPIVDIDPMEEKGVNIIGTFRTVVARQNCKEIGLLFFGGVTDNFVVGYGVHAEVCCAGHPESSR